MARTRRAKQAVSTQVVVFALVVVITIAAGALVLTTSGATTSSSTGQASSSPGATAGVTLAYRSCIVGYAGFQVTRQYENPATWTYAMSKGSTGYLVYQYNVTENPPFFLDYMNWTWVTMQGSWNGSYTWRTSPTRM